MEEQALINKKIVRRNFQLQMPQIKATLKYGKGDKKLLKNYLGKVVSLSSDTLVGKEHRISNFVDSITSDVLLAEIKKVCITGMSGNGFPIYNKIEQFISSASNKRVMIVNAVECDPGLLHDEWLLEHRYVEIIQAIHYLRQALSLQDVVLATKSKKLKPDSCFSVETVPARYPMGEEHFLIQQILHVELSKNEHPTEYGILVLNLQSVYQICKIINKCYDYGRFITIADLSSGRAKIAYVYPNNIIEEILHKEFRNGNGEEIYKGTGVMSCFRVDDKEDFSYIGNFAAYSQTPQISDVHKCRKCGTCDKRCPMKISLSKIVQGMDSHLPDTLTAYTFESCIRCGSCTYYCPASKNVAGYVRINQHSQS